MDYLYEQLGDERFQELCQALLVRELQNVQCFPVGQPDGGRDAIAYYAVRKPEASFSVFQVKYVRKPLAESDPHKWLLETIEKEAPKLTKLIPKGAKSYYLITNIPGTSHPDSGAIDKCQKVLSEHLSVPAQCWWRDDLNRRLDNAYDLKWVYPEIMAGTDMLRLIVESGLTEHKDRRASAIRAYVRAQYDEDKEVRFKQVELQNNLLDLFVDVPIGPRSGLDEHRRHPFFMRVRRVGARHEDEEQLGAATMLLDPRIQQYSPYVILEGAPGQGKSTLAQYICQVHRMFLLEEHAILQSLPEEHRGSSIKVPFKVDLRDLATWLKKRDPFSPEDAETVPDQWAKSLEAFLAAQIRYYSGGAEFSVADLHAVSKLSAILLVLDGLDEVADISERKDVVSAIVTGVSRLNELAASLQLLVTSRPTAFATSLGFPEKEFPHFQLLSLSKPLIFAYAERWLTARKLTDREAASVRRILKQKIEQPHLRDLARNPMQLAILLSLIHSKGPSLPDKRTSLYDKYVELFFNREAEKSEVVREHQELLIDLHRYLAWVLHYEAEKGAHRGNISNERLQKLLADYLLSEGRQDSSVADLFKGMVERIVFLVSRVEGTFEFEVQPLREYFAARHLYETAPYSPTGSERRGTKPDRFDAIVKSPYWLNVTRFFAGCFSKGELASLVDRLHNLSETNGYRYTNYPQRVAAILLGDWVFNQDQRSTREAVELVLDGIGLRHPLTKRRRPTSSYSEDNFVLPSGCGREQLISKGFSLLRKKPPEDYALEISHLLVANAASNELSTLWYDEVKEADGSELTHWLKCGLNLGVLSKCTKALLEEVFSSKSLDAQRLNIILSSGQVSFVEAEEARCITVIDSILEGTVETFHRRSDLLSRFYLALTPWRYAFAFENQVPRPLKEVIQSMGLYWEEEPLGKSINATHSNVFLQKCAEIVRTAEEELERNATEWVSDLTGWENIVEKSRSLWGEHWTHFRMANVAAGIRSEEVTCKEYSELLNHKEPLCRRVRHARLKAGAYKWWETQLEGAKTRMDKMLALEVFSTWASIPTMIKLAELMQELLDGLPSTDWNRVIRSIQEASSLVRLRPSRDIKLEGLPRKLSPRMVTVLEKHLKPADALKLYTSYISNYNGNDQAVLEFCEEAALKLSHIDPEHWKKALSFIEKRYAMGIFDDRHLRYMSNSRLAETFPITVAKNVAKNPDKYPRSLVYIAEERCQLEVISELKPVGDIAIEEGWFERDTRQRKKRV